ncbi:unnamed protein product, partial [Natator depressus]
KSWDQHGYKNPAYMLLYSMGYRYYKGISLPSNTLLLAEPLLHNPQLLVQAAESRSVRQSLVLAEVTRVGDLLDYDWGDWLDPLTLARRMGLSRPRTPGAYFR